MKRLIKHLAISFCLLAFIGGPLNAQNFSGIATYQSASSMKIQMSGEHGEMQISEDMQKQLNKQMQKEYTLKFNVSESTWKEVESLDGGPKAASSGNMMISFSSGGGGLLYKNTGESRYEREADMFGKPFLVKDALESYAWELTSETKKIGQYTAQKAIYSRIVDRRSVSFSSDEEEGEKEMETIKDTVSVTAWYTPEIPVTHGPESYWGLPGLILEVNNGSTTLICSKVVLNPEEGVKLEKPAKGKVVNQAEYDEIQDEKLKEMSKKFSNGNGNFMIKKGGN
jgi:GLPGLI family protein